MPCGGSPHCQLPFHGASNPQVLGAGGQRDPSPRGGGAFSLECRSRRRLPLSVPFGPLQAGGSCGEAFNRLGLPLLVVGDGPERSRLEVLAGPTVTLLGRQSQQQVEELMARCRAFVYAGLEDFGIAPVEAMASGAPVIGLGRGGLLDTVRCASSGLQDATGVLFPEQSVESLVQAVDWFEQERIWSSLDPESIRGWADASGRRPSRRALNRLCEQPGAPISGAVPLQRVTLRRCQSCTCDVECGESHVEPLTSASRPSLIQSVGRGALRGKYKPYLALISARHLFCRPAR